MNDKKIIWAVGLVLIFSIGYLFTAGDLKYQKSSKGSVFLAFEKTSQEFDKNNLLAENLAFLIENKEAQKETFSVFYFIDKEEIFQQEIAVSRNKTEKISCPNKVLDYILKNKTTQESFEYEIKIRWNEKEEEIYKKMIL